MELLKEVIVMNKEELNEHLGYNTDLYNNLADIFELEEDYQDKAWDKLKKICKHIYKIEKENQQLKEAQQKIDKAYIEFYDLIYHQIGYKYDLDENDNEKIENLLKTLKGEKND